MESVSYRFSWKPCCRLERKLVKGRPKLQSFPKKPLSLFENKCRNESLSCSSKDHNLLKNLYHKRVYITNPYHNGSRRTVFKLLSGNHYSSVIRGDEGLVNLLGTDEFDNRVSIPGLPDASGSPSISSCFWEWRPKLNVHYEKAGCRNLNSPPILFLPGFGVGSFHFEKQLKDLGCDYRVWAIDFLGQGKSLPFEDPAPRSNKEDGLEGEEMIWGFGDNVEAWASGLVYSVDWWHDQVRHFIEEVIGEPVYLVGNSLGGFVASYFAARNPRLVKGVTLLNATPFWGFLPNPVRSPRLARMLPWSGEFPLPGSVRKLTDVVWQKISNPENIAEILKQVYADDSANVDKVFSHILHTTQHPAAAAAFASIMFAPQGQLSFKEALSSCEMNKVPLCLMYGKEDPWVKPVWGIQIKRQLPEVPYYEISPAGHCPHDEVPEAVNYLLRGWIGSLESQGSIALPLLDDSKGTEKIIVKELEFIREESRKLVRVQYYGTLPSIWTQITSYFKSFGKSESKHL